MKRIIVILAAIAFSYVCLWAETNPTATVETNIFVRKFVTSGVDCYHLATNVNGIYNAKYFKITLSNVEQGDQIGIVSSAGEQFVNHQGLTVSGGQAVYHWTPQQGESGICSIVVYKSGMMPLNIEGVHLVTDSKVSGKLPNNQGYTGATEDYAIYYMDSFFANTTDAKTFADSVRDVFADQWKKQITELRLCGGTATNPTKPFDNDNLYEIFITDGSGQNKYFTDSAVGYKCYSANGTERRIFVESNIGTSMPEYATSTNALRALLAREFYHGVLNTINPQLMASTTNEFRFVTDGISHTIASILYPNLEINYTGSDRLYSRAAARALASASSMGFGSADEADYSAYALYWRYIYEHCQTQNASDFDKCRMFGSIVISCNASVGLVASIPQIDQAFASNSTQITSLKGSIAGFGTTLLRIDPSHTPAHWGEWYDPALRYPMPTMNIKEDVSSEKSYSLSIPNGSGIGIADFRTSDYFSRAKRISVSTDVTNGMPCANALIMGANTQNLIPLEFKRIGNKYQADIMVSEANAGNTISNVRIATVRFAGAGNQAAVYLFEIRRYSSESDAKYSPFEVPKIYVNAFMKSVMANSNPTAGNITFECDVRDVSTYPSVKLYYKKHNEITYASVPMNKKNPGTDPNANHTETYSCTIQPVGVGTKGVDFYFGAENSSRHSTLPEQTPESNPFNLFIAPSIPPVIAIKSITNLNQTTIERPIELIVHSASSPNALSDLRVYFRKIGSDDYTFQSLLQYGVQNEFKAVLPAIYATTEGIEYYIVATDQDGIVASLGQADSPRRLLYKDLRISSPTNSSEIVFGSPNRIVWTGTNMNYVNLYYKSDNADWTTISKNIPSAQGFFDWDLDFVGKHRVWIQAMDAEDSLTYSVVGPFDVRYLTNKVELTSPNGGENWLVGEKHDIEWTSTDIANVRLDWSTDGGNSWNLITASTPAAYGRFMNWSVPRTPSEIAMIRISDADHLPIQDASDANFRISGVRLKNPNGGEKLFMGLNYIVNWEAVGINYLTLQYSSDRGSNWTDLTISQDPLSNFYSWEVPMNPGNDYLFRTTDSDRSLLSDTSDHTFSVVGLLLKKPAGGEQFLAGTYQEIEWQSTQMQYVKLEYTTDNGSHWTTIMSQIPAIQSNYVWQVPKEVSPNCKVRVSNVADPAISDMNQDNFSISGVGIVVNYPNDGETLIANNTYTVSWFSVGIQSVQIDYSTDNGRNWINIAKDVPASQSSYQWTVPASPSVECLIRVADNNLPHLVDFSDKLFTIQGGLYPVPSEWNVFLTSDKTATIILPTSANPKVADRTMATGDAVGVFYKMPMNHWVCAGFSVYESGQNMAIAVFGDNPITSYKDGFADGEGYYLLVWDAQTGRTYEANVTYSTAYSLTPEQFEDDKISPITSLTTYSEFTVDVPRYVWSIISSNVVPNDNKIAHIAAPVLSSIKRIKDQNGAQFPAPGLLTDWNYLEGYQIYTTSDIKLTFYGLRANLASSAIALPGAMKWSLVPFLPQSAQSTQSALSSISTDMLLLKNYQGRVYFPLFSINQVPQMKPGEGYKICMINPSTLVYTELALPSAGGSSKVHAIFSQKYSGYEENTGNSANMLVRCDSASDGASVGVFTLNGLLVGSGTIVGNKAGITVWGDNSNTPQIEGATDNEALILKLWDPKIERERHLIVEKITDLLQPANVSPELRFGSDAALIVRTQIGAFTHVADDASAQLQSLICSPNPSNGNIVIAWNLPQELQVEIELINAQGVPVGRVFSGKSEQGAHSIAYTCPECESGVYFVRLRSAAGQIVSKVTIVR